MAEASAVVGILSFGIQVCQGITKYYGAWRGCPEDVASTSNTIDSLRAILEQFKHILADKQLEQDTRNLVQERVLVCLAGLRKLEVENKQFGLDKPSKFHVAVHRLAYPFKQDTLDRIKKVVGGLLGQLGIALQVLDIRAGSRHHDESSAAIADTQRAIEKVCTQVQVVRDLVDSVRAQHQIVLDHAKTNHAETIDHLERLRLDGQQTSKYVRQLLSDAEAAKLERILTWIRAPDVTSNHNAACLRRHPGTGQWFLDSADYLSWKYGSTARLWLHGKIGCCKTVLASTIIEDMRSHCRAYPDCFLAYFYITFSDDKKQSWEALLRALVMQLSQGHPAVQVLADAFDKEFGHGLTVRDLERALMDILEAARCEGRRIFVVIDALDESPDTQDHRDAVYKGLSRLAERCNDLHFLITSRRYADVEGFMKAWGASFVEITMAFVNEDIKSFVHCQLATNSAFSRVDDKCRSLITAKLSENPDGMFRWAALHLEALRKLRIKTRTRIEKALSILPPTLSATYEQMLSDIPDDCAVQVAQCLSWLALSPRPLALYELAEAMRVDPEKPDVTVLELDALDPGDMVEVMSGMVTTDHQRHVCQRCQSAITGNYFICHHCSWGFYDLCELCRTRGENCGDPSHVLAPCDTLMVQLAHASVEEFLLGSGATAERARRFLIDKAKRTSVFSRVIESPDIRGFTHLHSAVNYGRLDETRRLLAQGANVNTARVGYKETPLHAAAQFGDARMVAELISCGADVHASNIEGSTALTYAIIYATHRAEHSAHIQAVERDYEKCVRLLLQYGADPNLGSALVFAAIYGRTSEIRLLLDGGADINLRGPVAGATALLQAAVKGHDEITTMLLKWGADRDISLSQAPLALSQASAFGHHLVVKTLLAYGVDSAHRDSDGRTALHRLADSSDGSTADRFGLNSSTNQLPLQERYGLVLNLLLAQDEVDINRPDSSGLTPLIIACLYGHISFINRLLDHGPHLEARDDKGWTALFYAVDKGRESVVELLITRGARVNTVAWLHGWQKGWTRRSLLGAASHRREYRILDLLKAKGAKRRQDMNEEERKCDEPSPPPIAPKRRRSWPQYRPLEMTRMVPTPPRADEGILWDTQKARWNRERIRWKGEKTFTLSRSLSFGKKGM
ncbi:hypothetical protein LTR15_012493 [Elasticomyces elasticus]|nr:hypothetical protein LTR15_012493 [Elasticomyces elasticus]